MAAEMKILARKMPKFRCYEPTEPTKTYVAGRIGTPDGNKFELKLVLGKKYPDEMPELYVVSPHILPKRGGGTVNDAGLSHAFHTRPKGPEGCTQICHCNSTSWDPSKTVIGALIKGTIWCEAYREYMRTGKSIADFFSELERPIQDGRTS